MKKIFIAACMLTFAFMISAQGGQGGGQGGGQRQGGFQQTPEQIAARNEQWKKDLNLNDKQFAEFKKINEDYQAKVAAARQGGGTVDRDAMQKLRDDQTAKIKAALTADQFKKYEELNAAQRGQGGQGGQRGQGGGGGGGQRQN